MGCRTFVRLAAALAIWPVLLFAAQSVETRAAEEAITLLVVADFDYSDTSGEVTDQRAGTRSARQGIRRSSAG